MQTGANMVTTSTVSDTRSEYSDMVREQVSVLNEIKDILANSKDLQQQYVYNTYN
jgi:hypothetical protein